MKDLIIKKIKKVFVHCYFKSSETRTLFDELQKTKKLIFLDIIIFMQIIFIRMEKLKKQKDHRKFVNKISKKLTIKSI